MVMNLQHLEEEENQNVLLLTRFCNLHKVSHLEFECSHCQEVISLVLTQIMHLKIGQTPSEIQKENSSPMCIFEDIEMKRKRKI